MKHYLDILEKLRQPRLAFEASYEKAKPLPLPRHVPNKYCYKRINWLVSELNREGFNFMREISQGSIATKLMGHDLDAYDPDNLVVLCSVGFLHLTKKQFIQDICETFL